MNNTLFDKTEKYRLLDEAGFKKYFKAETWADYNRQFFDGLAPKYDRLNEVLSFGRHRQIKKKALAELPIGAGDAVLDLCTGSGDIALFLGEKFPDCSITAGDVSEKMLEIARARTKSLKNVRIDRADVLNLPYADASFDFTVISFGLRNLDDLERGIREMKRVTKPGGMIMNLDLGVPSNGFLKAVHELYFRRWIPFLGKVLFHRGEFNSFYYLPNSGRYFPEQSKLVRIFESAGLMLARRRDYILGSISQQIFKVI